MAASMPYRRTGCSVISMARSGLAIACEDRPRAPDGPVLGQRSAGLAHEPHRDPVVGLAPAGRDERRGGVVGLVHRVKVASAGSAG